MAGNFTDFLNSYLLYQPCNVWRISELESDVLKGMSEPKLYLDVLVRSYGYGYSPNGDFLFRPGFKGYHNRNEYPQKPIKVEDVKKSLKRLLSISVSMGYKEFLSVFPDSQHPVIEDYLMDFKAEKLIEIRGNKRKQIRRGIRFK